MFEIVLRPSWWAAGNEQPSPPLHRAAAARLLRCFDKYKSLYTRNLLAIIFLVHNDLYLSPGEEVGRVARNVTGLIALFYMGLVLNIRQGLCTRKSEFALNLYLQFPAWLAKIRTLSWFVFTRPILLTNNIYIFLTSGLLSVLVPFLIVMIKLNNQTLIQPIKLKYLSK